MNLMENDLSINNLKIHPQKIDDFEELILTNKIFKDKSIRQVWISEAKDRMAAIASGKAKLLDFEDLYNEN